MNQTYWCTESLISYSSLAYHSLILLKDYRCIMSTKAKCITYGNINFSFLCLIESVIQITFGVRLLKVDSRRYNIIFYCQNGDNSFNCTCGSKKMSGHAFS